MVRNRGEIGDRHFCPVEIGDSPLCPELLRKGWYIMSKYAWSNDYSVGNEILDQHHRNLIKLFNDAYETIKENKPFTETNKILSELTTYSIFHFYEEEKIMKNVGYAELENHKKQHSEFISKINEFKNNISAENSTLNEEIFLFLYNWLVNHICISDKKYVSVI